MVDQNSKQGILVSELSLRTTADGQPLLQRVGVLQAGLWSGKQGGGEAPTGKQVHTVGKCIMYAKVFGTHCSTTATLSLAYDVATTAYEVDHSGEEVETIPGMYNWPSGSS